MDGRMDKSMYISQPLLKLKLTRLQWAPVIAVLGRPPNVRHRAMGGMLTVSQGDRRSS